MVSAIIWGGLAAASLLIGYGLAARGISNSAMGIIMGLGAGALISAIAYELVPESLIQGWSMGIAFALGAVVFFLGDWLVDKQGGAQRKNIVGKQAHGSGAAIFIGTLLDNIPESLILGIGLVSGSTVNAAFLTAVFISNLPEGVAGTVNLEAAGYTRSRILRMWLMLVLVSAISAGVGYALVYRIPSLSGAHAQAFAAGAMLTMLADAMMPEAYEHGGKLTGIFTVMGFMLAAALSVSQ